MKTEVNIQVVILYVRETTDRLFMTFRFRFRNFTIASIKHMVFIIYGMTILILM
nr:MAG TPA: hypothetical protein [Caudoviricetes sp.]